MWITFAPGAFVWHHRRQGPRAYLKQQAGYGEAEALLYFKHPDQFNARGESKWRRRAVRRVAAGRARWPARSSTAARSAPACSSASTSRARPTGRCCRPRWSGTWPSVCVALAGLPGGRCGCVAGVMLAAVVRRGRVQADQARLPRATTASWPGWSSPACATPSRWSGRGSGTASGCSPSLARRGPTRARATAERLSLAGRRDVAYWTEEWRDRTELLNTVVEYLTEHRWGRAIDSGWSDWDLEVSGDRWTLLRVRTAQEEHGGGRRLIRVRIGCGRVPLWRSLCHRYRGNRVVAFVNPMFAAVPAVVTSGFARRAVAARLPAGRSCRVDRRGRRRLNLIRCGTEVAAKSDTSVP